MDADVNQKKIAEIKSLTAKITDLEEKVRSYLEHAAIKPGHDVLVLDRMLGLGTICGGCLWRKRQDFNYRLSYLMST